MGMAVMGIVCAGLVAWVMGAMWYTIIEEEWVKASGLPPGRSEGNENVDYAISLMGTLLSAAVMWGLYEALGIDSWVLGGMAGFGIALGLALPWVITGIRFARRDERLLWMDGTYPVLTLTMIGCVVPLF